MSEGLAARIRQCAEIAGSGDELARITGIPRRTLEYYLTGQVEPKISRCLCIANAVGVNVSWLASGEGEISSGEPAVSDIDVARVPVYAMGEMVDGQIWRDATRLVDHMLFSSQWLTRKNLQMDKLAGMNIQDDAMEVTLRRDDRVLVDLRYDTLREDGLYAIFLNGCLSVRRLQRQIGGLAIICDNVAYQPQLFTSEQIEPGIFKVLGRVIWSGRWF